MQNTKSRQMMADPELGSVEKSLLDACIEEGMISSQGRFVQQFESEFASACNAQFGVAVANGTCALHLAVEALEIGPGDEVVVPSLTFVATANCVKYAGATPVFADVDSKTLGLSVATVERAITSRTKAIIPVHLLGQPCDIEGICRLAKDRGLYVIEDAAEAHGAEIQGQRVGSFGEIGCFSFYANKIITTGEGGMCVTSEPALAERMRVLRSHGMAPNRRYWHEIVGYNYRMTNLQAAVGVAQVASLDKWVEKRRWVAKRYRELLSGIGDSMYSLEEPAGTKSACWMSLIMLKNASDRDFLIQHLDECGVESRPLFWPVHQMPPYRNEAKVHLPISEDLSQRGVMLPSHTKLTDDDLLEMCDLISTWFAQRKDAVPSRATIV